MLTKIIAHRGDREHYPENTMASFESAVQKGVDGIELDVHLSKDGKLIVHHDYCLGTTNNGEGLIAELESSYIRSLDAGSWFAGDFAREKIPLLGDVLETFQAKTRYEIELKGLSVLFLEKVLEMVNEYNLLEYVEFTSPHAYVLSRIKEMEPAVKTGSFVQVYPSWMTAELGQIITQGNIELGHINVAHCPLGILSSEFVQKLQQAKIAVHTANCDTEEDIKKALSLNVDQFSTNKLDLALSIRNAITI